MGDEEFKSGLKKGLRTIWAFIPSLGKLIIIGIIVLIFTCICAYVVLVGDSGADSWTGTDVKHVLNGYEMNDASLIEDVKEGLKKDTPAERKGIPSGDGVITCPCASYSRVTSEFGYRTSPTPGASSNHQGIDLGCPYGTDLYAAVTGTVTRVSSSSGGGLGIFIETEINGEKFEVRYWHLSSQDVRVGDKVTAGDYIGKSGNSGISTGPHLHFETRVNGQAVDPCNYFNF